MSSPAIEHKVKLARAHLARSEFFQVGENIALARTELHNATVDVRDGLRAVLNALEDDALEKQAAAHQALLLASSAGKKTPRRARPR